MKKFAGMALFSIGIGMGITMIVASCQKSEVVSELTGTESTYALQQGSQFSISGVVTFKERKDGKSEVFGKSP